MSAHDRYLAGYSSSPIHVTCPECEHDWEDTLVTEYGASWLEIHEDCPQCGNANLDTSDSYGPDEDSMYDEWRDSQFDRDECDY